MIALGIWNFLHFIGLALGLGGATILNIISLKSRNDNDIAKALSKIIPSIVSLIWVGIFLLIVSGIALPFYITWPLNKQILIIKHILVVWIIVIGIILGVSSKKRINLQWLGAVNLILWYIVTLLSVFV